MITTTRTRWGATRSGRRGLALWAPSLVIGLAVAAVLGGIAWAVNPAPNPALLGIVIAAASLPIGTVLGWVLLVDRTSLEGAVARPEESVESVWLDRAMAGALPDAMAAIGLAAGAIAVSGKDVPAGAVLIVLWFLVALDVAARYLLLRRQA